MAYITRRAAIGRSLERRIRVRFRVLLTVSARCIDVASPSAALDKLLRRLGKEPVDARKVLVRPGSVARESHHHKVALHEWGDTTDGRIPQ